MYGNTSACMKEPSLLNGMPLAYPDCSHGVIHSLWLGSVDIKT